MNRIFVAFTSMAFAVALVSCQETKEEMNQPLAEKEYYKTIGEQIPLETGMEWIEITKRKTHPEAERNYCQTIMYLPRK